MTPSLVLTVIIIYFGALLLISYITSRNADTNAFFIANKSAPWYLVAFGMIGTSLSGVTFISVPGKVGLLNPVTGEVPAFAYFQLILGNLAGYLVVGTILMPLYYRLNLISIYTYLEQRLGFWSYKTGAFFFIISRTIGSALRLYLAALVLHIYLFEGLGVSFGVTVSITIALIWVYTFKGGIKTIIWTDSFQTIFLVSSVIISVFLISNRLELSLPEMVSTVAESKYSKIFFWDVKDNKFFIKQFISGMFLAIVMFGLDQDLMQKNLSCKNIKEAQKNLFWFCVSIFFVNLLFLTLGALLYIYTNKMNIALPPSSDALFPMLAFNEFGVVAGIFFLLGITASSYASSDSALAALTTSFCIDFLDFKNKPEEVRVKQKFWVHIGFSVLFLIIIIIFKEWNKQSVIDAVLGMAAFTYGPLLGLFSFSLFTKRKVKDQYAPLICVLAPVLSVLINANSKEWFWGYTFSFEILLINGLLTFLGLWMVSSRDSAPSELTSQEI
jgi:Na+/proline symporter